MTGKCCNAKYFIGGMSLNEYCSTHGIIYNNVLRRLKYGKSVEEAIKEAKEIKTRVKYFYGGKRLSQYCSAKDIKYQSVLERISKGLDIEEAIQKTLEADHPERLKRIQAIKRRKAEKERKEHEAEMAYKKIKVPAREAKKADLMDSIHNLQEMLKHLDKGSIDYEKGIASINRLKKEMEKL